MSFMNEAQCSWSRVTERKLVAGLSLNMKCYQWLTCGQVGWPLQPGWRCMWADRGPRWSRLPPPVFSPQRSVHYGDRPNHTAPSSWALDTLIRSRCPSGFWGGRLSLPPCAGGTPWKSEHRISNPAESTEKQSRRRQPSGWLTLSDICRSFLRRSRSSSWWGRRQDMNVLEWLQSPERWCGPGRFSALHLSTEVAKIRHFAVKIRVTLQFYE